MAIHRPNYWFSGLNIQVSLQWCFGTTSTVWRSTSKGRSRRIMPLHTTSFSLSDLSRTPRPRDRYNVMGKYFSWLDMTNQLHTIVKDCGLCGQNGSQMKHESNLQLFPGAGPLQFVAIDVLRILQRTALHMKQEVIVTDRYSKLTRAIITRNSGRSISRIYSSAFGYSCMVSQPMYWPTKASSSSANSSLRHALLKVREADDHLQ